MKSEVYEIHCNIKYKATPVKIAGNSTLKLFNYICLFVYVVCHSECVPVRGQPEGVRFSPPTRWVLEMEFRLSGLAMSTFTF